jgi:hypothetical protein
MCSYRLAARPDTTIEPFNGGLASVHAESMPQFRISQRLRITWVLGG